MLLSSDDPEDQISHLGTLNSSGTPPKQTDGGATDWLVGGGEMGKLIRSMDRSATPLDPIESWRQSLRTTVSLCIASNFPISLAWELHHVQIANLRENIRTP